MSRRIVVIDTETSGLNPSRHEAVEVAWHDLASDTAGWFIPPHDLDADGLPVGGDPEALRINGYTDRIAGRPQDDGEATWALAVLLSGATLAAGSNPAFDSAMLEKLLGRLPGMPTVRPWHHRLLDLSAYAAGRLGLPPGDLPGLARVCELLDVPPPDHSAAGDVAATVACFRALAAR